MGEPDCTHVLFGADVEGRKRLPHCSAGIAALAAPGSAPDRLELEVTEPALMRTLSRRSRLCTMACTAQTASVPAIRA